jgi:hypothetical protein
MCSPSWANSRAILPAGIPSPLLSHEASAAARGPTWVPAPPAHPRTGRGGGAGPCARTSGSGRSGSGSGSPAVGWPAGPRRVGPPPAQAPAPRRRQGSSMPATRPPRPGRPARVGAGGRGDRRPHPACDQHAWEWAQGRSWRTGPPGAWPPGATPPPWRAAARWPLGAAHARPAGPRSRSRSASSRCCSSRSAAFSPSSRARRPRNPPVPAGSRPAHPPVATLDIRREGYTDNGNALVASKPAGSAVTTRVSPAPPAAMLGNGIRVR